MNRLTARFLLAVILLSALTVFLWERNARLRQEVRREQRNLEEITAENAREMVLSRKEYNTLNTRWKRALDSTLRQHEIDLKRVQAATIIKTQYRDTGSVRVVYQTITDEPGGTGKVRKPFYYDNKCWSVRGYVTTRDSASLVEITERAFSNSAQLVVTRSRVLGFLWWKRKKDFTAYSDCGVIDITQVNFVDH